MTTAPQFRPIDPDGRSTIEGFARVVSADGRVAVLEPEQTTSCGSCASASACGAKAGPNWLQARQFKIANDEGLVAGERVVVGIPEGTVVKGAMIAYALPLVTMMAGGVVAQNMGGGDGAAVLATLGGLAIGLGIARLLAGRLSARGILAPRFIRRAGGDTPGMDCHVD
ncbi:MAG: SoxR reducing system RseC family protein [Actinomycetota bacterium]